MWQPAHPPKPNPVSILTQMLNSNNDANILYHAAPVSGRCYNLDDATGAFFWNTGGMLNPRGRAFFAPCWSLCFAAPPPPPPSKQGTQES